MAWIFSLSAECGPERANADTFASHFAGYVARDHRGVAHPCHVGVYEDEGWWVTISPDGVSRSGIGCEEDRLQMNALASELYSALRSAPDFSYALVGVEVDSFRTSSEIDSDLAGKGFDGVVVSEKIWSRLRCPSAFVPFRPGYYWREFRSV